MKMTTNRSTFMSQPVELIMNQLNLISTPADLDAICKSSKYIRSICDGDDLKRKVFKKYYGIPLTVPSLKTNIFQLLMSMNKDSNVKNSITTLNWIYQADKELLNEKKIVSYLAHGNDKDDTLYRRPEIHEWFFSHYPLLMKDRKHHSISMSYFEFAPKSILDVAKRHLKPTLRDFDEEMSPKRLNQLFKWYPDLVNRSSIHFLIQNRNYPQETERFLKTILKNSQDWTWKNSSWTWKKSSS